jgi:glycine/D-amino acid oxidase-like deaminating enzyme
MPDVVVVGGGIIGAACAHALAVAGASVTLIERDELAAGASGRNQGWLVAPDDPVNRPLFEPSLRRYREVADRAVLSVWIDAEPMGHLLVGFEADPEPEHLEDARALDRRELLTLEPALSPDADRGWLEDGGFRLDPAALTVACALLAAEEGASIRHHLTVRALDVDGDRVRGVVTDDGRIGAGEVVLAAGPWSTTLLDPIGLPLPIRSARGWIVRMQPRGPLVHHLVERVGWRESDWRAGAAEPPTGRTFADEGLRSVGGALLNPHPDGSILIGSSREPAVGPEPADPTVPRHQVADAIHLVPDLATAEVRSSWWGVRPLSPDDRPLIGRVRDGLVVATGHGSEGVILGGGTAELVAAIVTGARSSFHAAPFDPLRFEVGR